MKKNTFRSDSWSRDRSIMVKVCREVTQATAKCCGNCAIMPVFQQTSSYRFIWLSPAFLSIKLRHSTLSKHNMTAT